MHSYHAAAVCLAKMNKYHIMRVETNSVPLTGPDCSETAQFVAAANMKGFKKLPETCKDQLARTGINANSVYFGSGGARSRPTLGSDGLGSAYLLLTLGFMVGLFPWT